MGFFHKIFGTRLPLAASQTEAETSSLSAASSSLDPKLVRIFDAFGRELFITREQWLHSVLLTNIEKAWNDPESLSDLMINALDEQFFEEIIHPAERLAAIDPNHERACTLLSMVYLKSNRIDDAQRILLDHVSRHQESGLILAHLAKVYATRNDDDKAYSTLERALNLDPNQNIAFEDYVSKTLQRDGKEALQNKLREIQSLPGSWRAQLWFANAALENKRIDDAVSLYQEALDHSSTPIPSDLLMEMSGDLGKFGHLPELLKLTLPQFSASHHGIAVGNNLIKATLDLGQLEEAHQFLDQLYALKRPEWNDILNFWDTEIAKARLLTAPEPSAAQIQLSAVSIRGAIWLEEASPAEELFPPRPEEGLKICFLCASVDYDTPSKKAEHQLSDTTGRLSRALPLYLAEHLYWNTDAQVTTFIPWVVSPMAGFIVSGTAWEDSSVSQFAREGEIAHDYAVTAHFKGKQDQWSLELRLIRTEDAVCLGTIKEAILIKKPELVIPEMTRKLKALCIAETGALNLPSPASYAIPTSHLFSHYLLRLEQLLAVRCAAMEGVRSSFLSGEREIVDGSIRLSLDYPESISVRLLLAQTLKMLKQSRPHIIPEFQEKIALLQRQHPLQNSAGNVFESLFQEIFTTESVDET